MLKWLAIDTVWMLSCWGPKSDSQTGKQACYVVVDPRSASYKEMVDDE